MLTSELEAIAVRYRGRPPVRVLYQIWDRPIYTLGGRHVISDALQICGASNVFADLDTAAPAVTLTGPADVTVECHGTFNDPGASATDACEDVGRSHLCHAFEPLTLPPPCRELLQ